MNFKHFLYAALCVAALAATGCKKDDGGRRHHGTDGVTAKYNENWSIEYQRQTVLNGGVSSDVDVFTLSSSDSKSYLFAVVTRNVSNQYLGNIGTLLSALAEENSSEDIYRGDQEVQYEPFSAGSYVAYMVGVDARGKATGDYCRASFTATDSGSGGGGGGSDTPADFKVNTNWTVSYTGRVTETDEDGAITSETFSCKAGSSERYLVTAIDKDVQKEYYSTVADYLQDEVDYLAQTLENYADFGVTIDDFTYTGSETAYIDKLRHGSYNGYMIGVDANGKATGDYAVCSFTVAEATPTDAFKKWLGTWDIGDGKTTFRITVSSAEANEYYTVTGWEAGETMEADFSDYSFETSFDAEKGTMNFFTQWLNEETDEQGTFQVGFYGMLSGDGGPDLEDGDVMATATLSDDTHAAVAAQSIEYYADESGSKTTVYDFVSMQYLGYDDEYYYEFDNTVPGFPMSMTRISGAAGTSLRPALRSYSSVSAHKVAGVKVRPAAHRAAKKQNAVRRMRKANPLKLHLKK